MRNRHIKKIAHSGFTLVEILIAIFILAMVMATVYASYSGILTTSRTMEKELDIYKMARTAIDRMTRDLPSLQTSAGSFDLRAERKTFGRKYFHSISFWSASHLAFGENESKERPAAISYYVRKNDDGQGFSLWRADFSGVRPDETKEPAGGFIICKNIDAFRMTFYDSGGRETDFWDSSAATGDQQGIAPAAVKIELFMVNPGDQEKPYKFMTKVFLPAEK